MTGEPAGPAEASGSTTDPDDVAAWLRLSCTPGISRVNARHLLARFGLPRQWLARTWADLSPPLSPALAQALVAAPDERLSMLIERTSAWLREPDNAIVTLADVDYPPALLDLADPPLLLYVKGDPRRLRVPSIAMVGARSATVQGARDAEAFARTFSAAGLSVVSGLALGIDAAAHAGALDGPGGTVAVIGTGADLVYPSRHRDLAHQIATHGAIVSEFPLGMPGRSHHFPQRNRIIAALSRGVLVVEAASRSGSLITAHQAAELGREVFAMPGSIHAPLARGCHQLIRQGAKLVESAQDVMEELGLPAQPSPWLRPDATATAKTPADPLGDALAFDPVTADALCERTGLSTQAVAAALLDLELAGALERLPGSRYRRLGRLG